MIPLVKCVGQTLAARVVCVEECCPQCGERLMLSWKYSSFGGPAIFVAKGHWCYVGGRR